MRAAEAGAYAPPALARRRGVVLDLPGGGRGVPGGRLHSPQLSRHDAFMYAALRSHSPADAHASHDSVSSWQSAVPFGSFGRDCGSFFGGA